MGESLRKITDHAAAAKIVLLAEQADIVAQAQQAIEQASCLREPLLQDIGVDQPEAAGQEGPLAGRQTVLHLRGVVAHHKSLPQEPLLDGGDGAADACIISREESDAGQQQQARVELLRPVGLHETSELLVEPVGANLGTNLRSNIAPSVDRPVKRELLSALDCTVECDPCHHLRIGEVLSVAANLPDAFIRFAPYVLEMRKEFPLHGPAGFACNKPVASRLMERIHHFAEYVELQLLMGGVTDAHGT